MNTTDRANDIVGHGDDHVSENCLATGTRLAEFEITGVIGEGGFGIVYMTFDHSLRRPVAVKEYMPASIALRGQDGNVVVRARRHQPSFDTGLKSFINEARLLAQFDHSALIKVHRFWEQNQTAYMAMRYYEGSTLKEIVQSDPARVSEAWLKPMLQSILEALDTLYHENVLHRDISPDNILILESGEAVLLDFGSARQVISDMSQSLTVILKPGYAPIEQYADDSAMTQGAWTDIYSLSAVMYLAIVKRPPPTSVARMVTDTMTPLADGHHPGFSRPFLSAIDRGLAIRPEQRPQTIDAFRRLLQIDGASAAVVPPVISAVPDVPLTLRPKTRTGDEASRRKRGRSERRQSAHNDGAARLLKPLAIAIIVVGILIIVIGSSYVSRTRAAAARAAVAAPLAAPVTEPVEEIITPAQLAAIPVADTGGESVALRIRPWASVSIDGVARGISPPLKTLTLTEGNHRVTLSNPNFPDVVSDIVVDKNRPATISHDFSRTAKSETPSR